MKKVINIITTLLFTSLLLGLVACSGDLHDMGDAPVPAVPMSIVGDIGGPNNAFVPFSESDKTCAKFTFTYTSDMNYWGGSGGTINFKVCEIATQDWNQCWSSEKEEPHAMEGGKATYVLMSKNKKNIVFSGLSVGKTYTVTATPLVGNQMQVDIEESASPTTLNAEALFVRGTIYDWNDSGKVGRLKEVGIGAEGAAKNSMVYQAYGAGDSATFEATGAEGEFALADFTWNTKYSGATVTVGTKETATWAKLIPKGEADAKVKTMTTGDLYSIFFYKDGDDVYAKCYFVPKPKGVNIKAIKVLNVSGSPDRSDSAKAGDTITIADKTKVFFMDGDLLGTGEWSEKNTDTAEYDAATDSVTIDVSSKGCGTQYLKDNIGCQIVFIKPGQTTFGDSWVNVVKISPNGDTIKKVEANPNDENDYTLQFDCATATFKLVPGYKTLTINAIPADFASLSNSFFMWVWGGAGDGVWYKATVSGTSATASVPSGVTGGCIGAFPNDTKAPNGWDNILKNGDKNQQSGDLDLNGDAPTVDFVVKS